VVDGGISAGWSMGLVRPDRELFFGAFQASRSANPKQPDANFRLLAHALLFDVEYQRFRGVVSAI
jgi:hypothetical protein